jgi:hypothetical protein
MRHITPERLDDLEAMLALLREIPELREKKRGVFYRKSRAFLHFHEDPKGLFADLRLGTDPGATGNPDDFVRYDVSSKTSQKALVKRIRAVLASRRPDVSGARTGPGRGNPK